MDEQKIYFMADLVKICGVHRNTIIRKTRKHLFLTNDKKLKRYYSYAEMQLIRNLFLK